MGEIRRIIGRNRLLVGDYKEEEGKAYDAQNRVFVYGCILESLEDGNDTAPATYDDQNTITFNTQKWKVIHDGREEWLRCMKVPADIENLKRQINELSARIPKTPVNIRWSSPLYSARIGEANTFPTLSGGDGLVITYRSSNPSVATISASGVVTPVSEGSCFITAEFAGDGTHEAGSDQYILYVTSEPHLNVLVGHGSNYESAQFTDTGGSISDNMVVSVTLNAGDYVFIKVDKRDDVSNLFTYPGPDKELFEFAVGLENPVVDGDYKYYRTTNQRNAGNVQYKINKV